MMEDSLIITIAFIFCSALVFTMFGFVSQWPRNIISYMLATVLWFTLGVNIVLTGLPYPHLGWAFIMLGVVSFFSTAIEGVSAFIQLYRREPWEQEEWEE